MNSDIKNAEGYLDLTPFKAIRNIEARTRMPYMPLVYICSPYRSDPVRNTERARKFCRFAVEMGKIPVAPHLLFPQFMTDENQNERKVALHMDLVLMSKCKELWVLGNTISPGMSLEIEKAKERKQRIRYFSNTFEEVRNNV